MPAKTNQMKRDHVLIADRVHPYLIQQLESFGFILDYHPDIDYETFEQRIRDIEGVVINSKSPMRRAQIASAKKLKWIARLGSGLDIIDLPYCQEKGVHVISAPEGNRNAVAEHALGMLLALQHQLFKANREVKQFLWQREACRGDELEGKTIGIIGYGNNGRAFAQKLAGLNVKVLAFDKYKQRYATEERFVKETSLEELQRASDVISLHVPLTEETRFWVDDTFLQNCKSGAILINTSRGKVVRTASVIKALENKHLKGACLDVFENEKVETYTIEEKEQYERLFEFEQVVVSPHVAGWSYQSLFKIAESVCNKILKFYDLKQSSK
jgi:D-3-phosphoglycerate dehydrogenase